MKAAIAFVLTFGLVDPANAESLYVANVYAALTACQRGRDRVEDDEVADLPAHAGIF